MNEQHHPQGGDSSGGASLSESALRRLARKNGYTMRRSRAAESLDQFGEFMLIEADTNTIVLGSRFDATLADIEAFFAPMEAAAKKAFCYKATLKTRGWTATMIRDHLGDPDKLATNPHHMSGPQAQLYDLERVEAVEKTPLFQARLRKFGCSSTA